MIGNYIIMKHRSCFFCQNQIKEIDYLDVSKLRPFLFSQGRIKPRKYSGACAKHQKQLARAIKRARHLALLPFVEK